MDGATGGKSLIFPFFVFSHTFFNFTVENKGKVRTSLLDWFPKFKPESNRR